MVTENAQSTSLEKRGSVPSSVILSASVASYNRPMADNLIHKLIPHQGCVITRTGDGIQIGDELGDVSRRGAIRLSAALRISRRRQITKAARRKSRLHASMKWSPRSARAA